MAPSSISWEAGTGGAIEGPALAHANFVSDSGDETNAVLNENKRFAVG